VAFEIRKGRFSDYERVAEEINRSNADLVCLQHEFGLFGGIAGDYILSFVSRLQKPLVTTLHTIMKEPEESYRRVIEELAAASTKIIVMSRKGREILEEVYGVPWHKIALIPHGIPDIPLQLPDGMKTTFYSGDHPEILTFGLLSRNKGIEVVLEALPPVVKKYPGLVYRILGATHPEVRKHDGEEYRCFLEERTRDLGLEKNVLFVDRFMDLQELCSHIAGCDLYITPYLSREQISSGTLSYAVGMGKAVISTPYYYAEDILADGRGILVDFQDSLGMSRAILNLLDNPSERIRIQKRAYAFGRKMIWKEVARRYWDTFLEVTPGRYLPNPKMNADPIPTSPFRSCLPEIRIDHLLCLTDEVGVIQHTFHGIPDRQYGYSADDVGRGLVVLCKLFHRERRADLPGLISRYLSFLLHSRTGKGSFHNFMGYDRRFLDEEGSEDTLGRVLWGLGHAFRYGPGRSIPAVAENLIYRSLGPVDALRMPRGIAYSMLGLSAALEGLSNAAPLLELFRRLADRLMNLFIQNRKPGWEWFEDRITYGNAKLPEALLAAYQVTGENRYLEAGLTSLEFLTEQQWNGEYFDIVGNRGWFPFRGSRAIFDQQPIDPGYLAEAYSRAYGITGGERYLELAKKALEWFWGRNRLGEPLYDDATGAVADGLNADGINPNQGAESVICFLLALLSIPRQHSPQDNVRETIRKGFTSM